MIGNVAGFETMGLVDGPGVRFVVFLQGCPLRCLYCHNPEMWNNDEQKIQISPEELVKKIKRYKPYFKDIGGVTISGGEPLTQAEFVCEVFKLCKENGIHTCLDTSGFGKDYDKLLSYCDLVILDVKELDAEKYKKLTGKKIDQFFKFVETCQKKNKKLWLRQVIVPGLNDTVENVKKLNEFAKSLSNVEKVELLPYHTMGVEKYEKLGIKYRLDGVQDMDKKECEKLLKYLTVNKK